MRTTPATHGSLLVLGELLQLAGKDYYLKAKA